jgi:hypothetical protein
MIGCLEKQSEFAQTSLKMKAVTLAGTPGSAARIFESPYLKDEH